MMAIDYILTVQNLMLEHFKILGFVNPLLYKFVRANAPLCTLLPMYLIQNPYFQSPYFLPCRSLKAYLFKISTKL